MGLQLKPAQELRDRRIDHERIENIDVIADENARPRGIESRRALHFESRAREPQNVAEK